MPKTIRELADELKVSKQTIQYHYQRLPTKNQQKDSQGTNMISLTAERIIRDKVAKPLVAKDQQIGSKKATKTSKKNNDLIATLRKEVADLKSRRDKQLATKDQQISSKDRQIDHLTKVDCKIRCPFGDNLWVSGVTDAFFIFHYIKRRSSENPKILTRPSYLWRLMSQPLFDLFVILNSKL